MSAFQKTHLNFLLLVPAQLKKLKISASDRLGIVGRPGFIPLSIAALFGASSATWLMQSVLALPTDLQGLSENRSNSFLIAQTNVAQVEVFVPRQGDEPYETLLSRAEFAVRAAADRNFRQNSSITNVRVIASAESNGIVSPIISLRLNRNQWNSQPDIMALATYFPSTKTLLGFENPVTAQTGSIPVAPTTTDTPTQGFPQPIPGAFPTPPGTSPPPPGTAGTTGTTEITPSPTPTNIFPIPTPTPITPGPIPLPTFGNPSTTTP